MNLVLLAFSLAFKKVAFRRIAFVFCIFISGSTPKKLGNSRENVTKKAQFFNSYLEALHLV